MGEAGEDAFYSLMKWQHAKFLAKPCDPPAQTTITTSAMALLMEGARRIDEG
jgi:hypothetical protein